MAEVALHLGDLRYGEYIIESPDLPWVWVFMDGGWLRAIFTEPFESGAGAGVRPLVGFKRQRGPLG